MPTYWKATRPAAPATTDGSFIAVTPDAVTFHGALQVRPSSWLTERKAAAQPPPIQK